MTLGKTLLPLKTVAAKSKADQWLWRGNDSTVWMSSIQQPLGQREGETSERDLRLSNKWWRVPLRLSLQRSVIISQEPSEAHDTYMGRFRRMEALFVLFLGDKAWKLTTVQQRRLTPSPPRKRKSSRCALQHKPVNKLVYIPKLQIMRPRKQKSQQSPIKRLVVAAEPDHKPFASFNYNINSHLNNASQTINPFKLIIQPTEAFQEDEQMSRSLSAPIPKLVRFERRQEHMVHSPEVLSYGGFDYFRGDEHHDKPATWNNPLQNPLHSSPNHEDLVSAENP